MTISTIYSDDGVYRYLASEGKGRSVGFIVDFPRPGPVELDITVARCEAIARELGFDAWRVASLYAYQGESESDLVVARRTRSAIIGPTNLSAIEWVAENADLLIVAWGQAAAQVFPETAGWLSQVEQAMVEADAQCFGTTDGGHPIHVLDVASLVTSPYPGDAP